MLLKLEEAYREGAWDAWTETPDDFFHADRVEAPKRVGEAVTLYVAYVEANLAETTQRTRRAMVKRFEKHVGPSTYLERVTAAHVESFVEQGDPKPQTARQRLTGLGGFFTFCLEQGMINVTPTEKVEAPDPPAKLPRAVTEEELEAIVDALPEGKAWCGPVFRFAALTGLRASELSRLRRDDVDPERRLLKLEQQKNGTAGTQPMPPAALAILDSLPRRNEYVFTSPLQQKEARNIASFRTLLTMAFKAARDAAGIDRPITLHGLRHGFCTRLAESGASAFTIQAAARHGSVTTSQRYVSISNQKLRAELDAVFG
jgi:integrase/recombinase XerD